MRYPKEDILVFNQPAVHASARSLVALLSTSNLPLLKCTLASKAERGMEMRQLFYAEMMVLYAMFISARVMNEDAAMREMVFGLSLIYIYIYIYAQVKNGNICDVRWQ
ncbi:hypothetical protein LY78DRAFT_159443 [Colletotrichum sublineola]|nr:hypothetical protein LY78DRAFT_159443 [Colletotrichum sublineola]